MNSSKKKCLISSRHKKKFLKKIEQLKNIENPNIKTVIIGYCRLQKFVDIDEDFFNKILLQWMDITLNIKNKIKYKYKQKFYNILLPFLTKYFTYLCKIISLDTRRKVFKHWISIIDGTPKNKINNIISQNIGFMTNLILSIFASGNYLTQKEGFTIFLNYFENSEKNHQEKILKKIFSNKYEKLIRIFRTFNNQNLDLKCRTFLNCFNMELSEEMPVFSMIVTTGFLENIEIHPLMVQNKKSDLWIDFNSQTKSISFFCSSTTFSQSDENVCLSFEAKVLNINLKRNTNELEIQLREKLILNKQLKENEKQLLENIKFVKFVIKNNDVQILEKNCVIEFMNTYDESANPQAKNVTVGFKKFKKNQIKDNSNIKQNSRRYYLRDRKSKSEMKCDVKPVNKKQKSLKNSINNNEVQKLHKTGKEDHNFLLPSEIIENSISDKKSCVEKIKTTIGTKVREQQNLQATKKCVEINENQLIVKPVDNEIFQEDKNEKENNQKINFNQPQTTSKNCTNEIMQYFSAKPFKTSNKYTNQLRIMKKVQKQLQTTGNKKINKNQSLQSKLTIVNESDDKVSGSILVNNDTKTLENNLKNQFKIQSKEEISISETNSEIICNKNQQSRKQQKDKKSIEHLNENVKIIEDIQNTNNHENFSKISSQQNIQEYFTAAIYRENTNLKPLSENTSLFKTNSLCVVSSKFHDNIYAHTKRKLSDTNHDFNDENFNNKKIKVDKKIVSSSSSFLSLFSKDFNKVNSSLEVNNSFDNLKKIEIISKHKPMNINSDDSDSSCKSYEVDISQKIQEIVEKLSENSNYTELLINCNGKEEDENSTKSWLLNRYIEDVSQETDLEIKNRFRGNFGENNVLDLNCFMNSNSKREIGHEEGKEKSLANGDEMKKCNMKNVTAVKRKNDDKNIKGSKRLKVSKKKNNNTLNQIEQGKENEVDQYIENLVKLVVNSSIEKISLEMTEIFKSIFEKNVKNIIENEIAPFVQKINSFQLEVNKEKDILIHLVDALYTCTQKLLISLKKMKTKILLEKQIHDK